MYSITCYGDCIRYQQRRKRRLLNCLLFCLWISITSGTKTQIPSELCFLSPGSPLLFKKQSLWLQFSSLASISSEHCTSLLVLCTKLRGELYILWFSCGADSQPQECKNAYSWTDLRQFSFSFWMYRAPAEVLPLFFSFPPFCLAVITACHK